jgi:hypothetical protein
VVSELREILHQQTGRNICLCVCVTSYRYLPIVLCLSLPNIRILQVYRTLDILFIPYSNIPLGLSTLHGPWFVTQTRDKTVTKVWRSLNTLERHYLLTYLLTPRSRVLLEKLTGLQLVKKFPTFYGTRRFITAFKIACHLSLS